MPADQRLQLLAATAEDEGIAPFSRTTRCPSSPRPAAAGLIPSAARSGCPPAPTKMRLASPAHQRHHLVGDQAVIDHHVRLHLAQGVQGGERIPRGRPPPAPPRQRSGSSSANRLSGQLIGRALSPGPAPAESIRPEQPFPEAAPLSHAGEASNMTRSTGCQRRSPARQMLGQQGLEVFPAASGPSTGALPPERWPPSAASGR